MEGEGLVAAEGDEVRYAAEEVTLVVGRAPEGGGENVVDGCAAEGGDLGGGRGEGENVVGG